MREAEFIALKYALFTTAICYLPHVFDQSYFISLLFIVSLFYRFLSIHIKLPYPSTPLKTIFGLIILVLLYFNYHSTLMSGFYISFLLSFIALKVLEIKTVRDIKALVICNFYIVLSVLINYQELWGFIYIVVTLFLNFFTLLKLIVPTIQLKQSAKRVAIPILLSIPLTFVFFFIFPRLSHPLWQVPTLTEAKIGFSEEVSLDNIASLYNDDSIVMRIMIKPYFKTNLYWRGLTLSFFNGRSWKAINNDADFLPLPQIGTNETPDYQILLEPHQKKWLFYQDYPRKAHPPCYMPVNKGLYYNLKLW